MIFHVVEFFYVVFEQCTVLFVSRRSNFKVTPINGEPLTNRSGTVRKSSHHWAKIHKWALLVFPIECPVLSVYLNIDNLINMARDCHLPVEDS